MLNIRKYRSIFANVIFDVIILARKMLMPCPLCGLRQDALWYHLRINFVLFPFETRLVLVFLSFRSRLFFVLASFTSHFSLAHGRSQSRSPPIISNVLYRF
jgi:hypothetical protein